MRRVRTRGYQAPPTHRRQRRGGTDDYRCFVVDPRHIAPSFVTGVAFLPGNPATVHHSILFRVDPGQVSAALAKDAADPRPGWESGCRLHSAAGSSCRCTTTSEPASARQLVAPVTLREDDTITNTCTHDPSLRDRLPALQGTAPHYVVRGEGATDETCLGILIVSD